MYTDGSLCTVLEDEKNIQGAVLVEFIRDGFTGLSFLTLI